MPCTMSHKPESTNLPVAEESKFGGMGWDGKGGSIGKYLLVCGR